MAIERNRLKTSRSVSDISLGSRDSMWSGERNRRNRSSSVDSDDDQFDEVDSGAESDDFDLLELEEAGEELCRFGSQTCSVPFELYDLPNLREVLSLDAWNECLTEEERFTLTQHLPDMDQHSFMHTMKELFSGDNFHFGSPITRLFDMLRGGLCDPRVSLYQQAMNYFQRREHYHLLRKHQNDLVGNVWHIKNAWRNCKGYSTEERLRVLCIPRGGRGLVLEKGGGVGIEDESGFSGREVSSDDNKVKTNRGRKSRRSDVLGACGGSLNFPFEGNSTSLESKKQVRRNQKGPRKSQASKMASDKKDKGLVVPSSLDLAGSSMMFSQKKKPSCHNINIGGQVGYKGVNDKINKNCVQNEGISLDRYAPLKSRKKIEVEQGEDFASDSSVGFSLARRGGPAYSKSFTEEVHVPSVDKPANSGASFGFRKKFKHPETFKQPVIEGKGVGTKGKIHNAFPRGSKALMSEDRGSFLNTNIPEDDVLNDHTLEHEPWDVKSRRLKGLGVSSVSNRGSCKTNFPQIGGKFHGDRIKLAGCKMSGKSRFDGCSRGATSSFAKNEETESSSFEEEEEENPSMDFPETTLDNPGSYFTKGGAIRPGIKNWKHNNQDVISIQNSSRTDFVTEAHVAKTGNFSSKKPKGKARDMGRLQASASHFSEHFHGSGSGKFEDVGDDTLCDDVSMKGTYKFRNNGYGLESPAEFLPPRYGLSSSRMRRPEENNSYSPTYTNNLYNHSEDDDEEEDEADDGSQETQQMDDFCRHVYKKGERLGGRHDASNDGCHVLLSNNNPVKKKRKIKAEGENHGFISLNSLKLMDESSGLKRRGKWKIDPGCETTEAPFPETGTMDMDQEMNLSKKPFTLITPTFHTGFSFSIVHLLSAVRMAMVATCAEGSLHPFNSTDMNIRHGSYGGDVLDRGGGRNAQVGASNLQNDQRNAPSLSVQDIVNRVRSNPGDPSILETQEPLQDLVRGVLRIFSSKTAPLGAKGWKALVNFEKPKKRWLWVGPPVSHNKMDSDVIEEVTSPETWCIPHKMLVKLVDAFANWLKSGQETLQQIGSLPAPPQILTQFNLDEKERFRDLRAQKSLTTISTSSEEVRDYFRKEEFLRYSVPDRAFAYTAADGRKSIVAPLRRCGGKPTSKARDHFMLKRDRPPHVTILCLVRDAAARLPGSIGTRADVCTLIRDSQFIVEDVPDVQVNQVVSGALDRLHYERDPCVQFDGDRKLWVYLHQDREEEDFEDDGTSSTKKWKRQKKELLEEGGEAAEDINFHRIEEGICGDSNPGFDFGADLNVDPSCTPNHSIELVYDDSKPNVTDIMNPAHCMSQGGRNGWEGLRLTALHDNGIMCQENSLNEDFSSMAYMRERSAGFLSTRFL